MVTYGSTIERAYHLRRVGVLSVETMSDPTLSGHTRRVSKMKKTWEKKKSINDPWEHRKNRNRIKYNKKGSRPYNRNEVDDEDSDSGWVDRTLEQVSEWP